MKKTLFIFGFLIATAFSINAQTISKNALGIRIGDNDGFGGEISYQRALGDNNRLELDLGIRERSGVDAFKVTGVYQWVWNLEGGFNWFAGVGGGVGSFSGGGNSTTFAFAAADIGIEYNFDGPVMISLDYRPEFGFSDTYDGVNSDIALGIRFQF